MVAKGSKMSKESRLKMSLAAKKRLQSPEARKKLGSYNIGNKYNLGRVRSEEVRTRISNTLKGKRTREQNPCWKGGIVYDGTGHRMLRKPEHPFARKQGYISLSRFIMEEHLGRYLNKGEIIHHINGIKDDDRIENLMLFKNRTEHMKHHHSLVVYPN